MTFLEVVLTIMAFRIVETIADSFVKGWKKGGVKSETTQRDTQ